MDKREEGVEGALSFFVTRDGRDSAQKIVESVRRSPFRDQVRAIITHTVTLAGFNIIDIRKLSKSLNVPVVCVTKRKPDEAKVLAALENFRDWNRRAALIENAGKLREVNGFWYYCAGIGPKEAEVLLKRFRGYPWPLRLAHIVAGAVEKGFSTGRP